MLALMRLVDIVVVVPHMKEQLPNLIEAFAAVLAWAFVLTLSYLV